MKSIIKIFILSFFTLFFISCNEESLVEGLIPTKPIIIEINQVILKGNQKNIVIPIEGNNFTFNANYYFQLSGNLEVRQLSIGYGNNITPNYLTFQLKGSNNIGVADSGILISSLFSSQAVYNGMLLYSLNNTGSTSYNYYTINNVTQNNNFYIPFKTLNINTNTDAMYGYILCRIEPSKCTIFKCVYQKTGNLKAGEE